MDPKCGEPVTLLPQKCWLQSASFPTVSPQVRLLLGQEEVRVQTPAEMLLSDSVPHIVELTVSDSWALLSVDGLLNASAPVQGTPLEVPYGLFRGHGEP